MSQRKLVLNLTAPIDLSNKTVLKAITDLCLCVDDMYKTLSKGGSLELESIQVVKADTTKQVFITLVTTDDYSQEILDEVEATIKRAVDKWKSKTK